MMCSSPTDQGYLSFLQIGDVAALNKISNLMQGASPASSPTSSLSSKPSADPAVSAAALKQETNPSSRLPPTQKEKDASSLEGARICASFAQTTAVLEQWDETKEDERQERIREAKTTYSRCRALLLLEDEEGGEQSELGRIKSKAGRALERLRRASVKVIDARSKGGDSSLEELWALLSGIVGILEAVRFLHIYSFLNIAEFNH